MTTDQQSRARRIFGSLVTLGEGTQDTRRRVRVTEFGDDPDTTEVIDTFGAARLLVFDRHPATREPTVEIAHEALIRAWPRLRTWLDEDRDELRIHRHLTDTATAWMAAGRDPGELYRGGRLDAAEPLLMADHVRLNALESEFLRASVGRRDADAAGERRRVHRLHRLVTATALVAVAALIAGGIALHQRGVADRRQIEAVAAQADAEAQALAARDSKAVAEQQTAVAEAAGKKAADEAAAAVTAKAEAQAQASTSRALGFAGQAIAMLDIGLDRALELAIEGYRTEDLPETRGALLTVLSASAGVQRTIRFADDADDVVTTGLDRSGTRAAVLHRDQRVEIWDLNRGTPIGSAFTVSSAEASTIEFDTAGGRVAIGYASGIIEVWDRSTGKLQAGPLSGPDGPVYELEFTTDGDHLVSLDANLGSGTWWDLESGDSKPLGKVISVAALPNDDRFITGSATGIDFESDVLQWWDGASGTTIGEPLTPTGDLLDLNSTEISNAEFPWPVVDVAVSRDGTTLATTHMGGITVLRHLAAGTVTVQPDSLTAISPLAFSPDGSRLAGITSDGSVSIWRTDGSQAPAVLPGVAGVVDDVTFDSKGLLAIVGPAGARVVDPEVGPPVAQEVRMFDDLVVDTVFYLPDGRLAASGYGGETGSEFAIYEPDRGGIERHPFRGDAVSTDGQWLATADPFLYWQGLPTLEVRDLRTGDVRRLRTPDHIALRTAFSPDGTRLATVAEDKDGGEAVFWFTVPGFELERATPFRQQSYANYPTGLSFSGDGAVLAVAGNRGPAVLIDPATGEVIRTLETEAPGAYAVALDHDGSHLFVDSTRGDLVIDLADPTMAPRVLPGRTGEVAGFALSSDERTLYGISDGGLIIWDLESESNQRVGTPIRPGLGTLSFGGGRSIALAPDGKHVAVGYGDGRVVVWEVDPEAWAQRACALVPQSEFCP